MRAAVSQAAARAVRPTVPACTFQQSITSAAQAAPRCLLAGARASEAGRCSLSSERRCRAQPGKATLPERHGAALGGERGALQHWRAAGTLATRLSAPGRRSPQALGWRAGRARCGRALPPWPAPVGHRKQRACRQLCLRRVAHDARRGRRRRPLLRGRLPRCRPEPARRRGAAGCTGRAAAPERSPAGRAASSGRRAPRGTQRRAQRAHAPERATAAASACAQRRGCRCLPPPGGEQSCTACPWPLAAVSSTERGGALWCLCSEAGRSGSASQIRPCRALCSEEAFARRRPAAAARRQLPCVTAHTQCGPHRGQRHAQPRLRAARSPAGGREARARRGAAPATRALPGASDSSRERLRAAPMVPLLASSWARAVVEHSGLSLL
jgi:hypothetical protein